MANWFLPALGILTLIGVLEEPLSAILGILVLLCAAAFAVVASHIVFVRQRTALIVQSQQHDAVLWAVLDTGYRLEQVYIQYVLQSDRKPLAPLQEN